MKTFIPCYFAALILSFCIAPSCAEDPKERPLPDAAPTQVEADEKQNEEQPIAPTKESGATESTKSSADYLDEATKLKITAQTFQDLEQVIQLCKKAIAVGLDEPNLLFAKQLIVSTRIERATRFCEEIFDRNPPSENWLALARIALADLELAIQRQDNLPEAHLLIGRIQTLPRGDLKKARHEFGKAIEQSANHPAIQAMALTLRGEITDDGKKKLADYNRALTLQPELAIALRARGAYYIRTDNIQQATEDFQKAAALEPDNFRVHEALALSLFFQSDLDQALASLNRAIELDPDSGSAYAYRAQVYLKMKRTEKALSDINRALELVADNLSWRLLRARIHQAAGNTRAALDDIERVLAVDAKLLNAVEMRARVLAANGRMDEALAGLQRAIEAMPDNNALLMIQATFFVTNKQEQRALDIYEKLLTKPSIPVEKHGSIYRSRGDLLLNLGRQTEAIAAYEKALQLNPEDAGLLNNLAWVLATSPEAEIRDGKRSLKLAIQACQATEYKKAHILSTLAAAHAENGDFESAINWSSKAVQLGDERADEQLEAELKSYQAGNPWREIQGQDKPQEAASGVRKEAAVGPLKTSALPSAEGTANRGKPRGPIPENSVPRNQ